LPITGPEALSFAEATDKIATAIGKRLTFQPISDEEARRRYAARGPSEAETEAHVALWRAIREGRLATVTHTLERVRSMDDRERRSFWRMRVEAGWNGACRVSQRHWIK